MQTAVLVAFALSLAGPQVMPPPPPPPPIQGPVRDPGRRPPPEATGRGIIRGRVVTADTGTPIRRAQVNLSSVAPPPSSGTAPNGVPVSVPSQTATVDTVTGVTTVINGTGGSFVRPKSVTTDGQGVFEFKDLPAGSYRIVASPGQYSASYLPIAYGAKRPNVGGSFDAGVAIQLADGQTFDKATIGLPRGAVITGHVVDENGEPLARVQVFTLMFPPGSTRGMRSGNGASTDDLGQFRLFGLSPADYVVGAEARGNTYVAPNAPPETEEDKIGFLTTYFPGTPDEGSAQRIRTKTGTETPGVEIHMITGRLLHVTGTVSDSQGRPAARSNGSLFKRTAGNGFTSTYGFSSDEQGRFQMRNIPPGEYRLTVRLQPSPQVPRNPDGSLTQQPEFASVPLVITADMDDVLITTSPGVTISGTVTYETAPPQVQGTQAPPLRVMAQIGDPEAMMGAPSPQPAIVAPDLTFTLKGMQGEYLLRANVPNTYVKQVLLGGEDITDTPHTFKNGDRVTIVLTSRAATVEGNVTDAAGKPATETSLVMFSDDKTAWRGNSLHTRRGGVDANGHFRIQGVLPGRYFIVALPRERMNGLSLASDPAVFEALSKEATTLVVGEDEQRQVDLKVSGGGH